MPALNVFPDGAAFEDSSGMSLRFFVPPVLVVMLLAGGVIWMKNLPSSLSSLDSGGTIQVRLLRTPDSAPTPLQAVDDTASPNVNAPSDAPRDQTEPNAEDVAPTSPPVVVASIDRNSTPTSTVPSSVSRPPSHVAVRFQQTLIRHIERFQRYPGAARRDRLEGTVQVAFVMERNGKILEAWVRSSSGQVLFDKEAVDALRRAEPLPVIPGGLPSRLSVLMPIVFAAQ